MTRHCDQGQSQDTQYKGYSTPYAQCYSHNNNPCQEKTRIIVDSQVIETIPTNVNTRFYTAVKDLFCKTHGITKRGVRIDGTS